MAWEFKPLEPEQSTPPPVEGGTPPIETPPPSAGSGTPPPTETAPPADAPKPIADEELLKVLNERGITISKFDDIKTIFESSRTYEDKVTALNKQVEDLSKKELEFPNEKAKELYQFAVKYPGNEVSAAKNLLNVVGLDLQKEDPKRLQFEAFVLQYPNYPREEAKAIFDARYEKKYGDGSALATDLDLKFDHDQATVAAQLSIANAVKGYMEAKSPEPPKTETNIAPTEEQVKRIEEVKRGVEVALKDFKGSTINLPEYQTKEGLKVPASVLNVEIKPEEAAKFRGYLEQPESFLKDVIGKFKGEQGLDWNGYANYMHQLTNPQESYAKIHSQGIEKGMLIILDKLKNSGGQTRSPEAGGDGTVKKSKAQQFDETRKPVEV